MSEKAIVLPVITESQACGSRRLTWAATPRLTCIAAVGARPFPWADTILYLSVSFIVITPITDTCGPFCRLDHRKHDLVISLTCWHYKAGDILQRTSRTQTTQGVRALGRRANLLRKREARKLMSPEASRPASVFFWHWGHFYMLSAPCHSWWYVLTGTRCLLCQELTEYPLRNTSGLRTSKQNANHSSTAFTRVHLRKHWEHWEVNQFYQCDPTLGASRKRSEGRKCSSNHQMTG